MADNTFYASDLAPEDTDEDLEKYRPEGVTLEEWREQLQAERTADDPTEEEMPLEADMRIAGTNEDAALHAELLENNPEADAAFSALAEEAREAIAKGTRDEN